MFQGDWKNQFDEKNTNDQDFYTGNNKTITVQMMYQQNDFFYGVSEELDAQVGRDIF